jgi:hypothetical protein
MYDWELPDDALKAWVRLRQASDAVERVLETGMAKHDVTVISLGIPWLSLFEAPINLRIPVSLL